MLLDKFLRVGQDLEARRAADRARNVPTGLQHHAAEVFSSVAPEPGNTTVAPVPNTRLWGIDRSRERPAPFDLVVVRSPDGEVHRASAHRARRLVLIGE